MEFYATIEVLEEDDLIKFRSELTRNSILIKRVEQENNLHHFILESDANGYEHLVRLSEEPQRDYTILSIEKFQD